MKNLTSKLMIAAAAMAAVAGGARAQTMKVEVPFAFSVSGKVMQAGAYSVSTLHQSSGIPVFHILNTDSRKPVIALPREARYNGDGAAKLVFRCGADGCALAQIWTGGPAGAYDLHLPKTTSAERAMIEIRGEPTKAE